MADRLYVEDLHVGDTREHGSFSLTQDEMIAFAQRFDPAPFHADVELARDTFFGGIVASGLHTVSALYRLVYDGLMSRVAVAAGRGVIMRAKAPVHPDEQIDVRTTISDVQDSPTRAGYGIVTITAEGTNPAGDVAMVATFEALVHRRAALPEAD